MFDWLLKSNDFIYNVKPQWDSGNYFNAVVSLFNRMPDITCRALFGYYDPSKDHDVSSLEFWWREVWHFIGGVLFALPFFAWCPWYIPTVGVFGYAAWKEFTQDVKDQNGKADFKNYVDTIVWTLGALSISLLGSLI